MSEMVGMFLAAALTLAIFSRAWRVNAVFAAAEYLLLGALTGYVAAIVLRQVLVPGLVVPLLDGRLAALIPLALIVLLALRFVRAQSLRHWGLLPLGILLGGGGALAVAGALRGTLIPQILAAQQLDLLPTAPLALDLLTVLLATLTTIGVLAYLQDGADAETRPMPRPLALLAKWGYLALMIAFGALLATTAGARITLLVDRVQWLMEVLGRMAGG